MPLINVFAAAGVLDRAGERRGDSAWIAKQWSRPETRVLRLSSAGDPEMADGRLVFSRARAERTGEPLFLGLTETGPVFAAEGSEGVFADLRGAAGVLSPDEANLAATARAVFGWHRRHGFCAVCGVATDIADTGWKRVCPACGAQHFPRTDPVVIMLALQGERCLLGRAASWPEGRYSALAGFLEPGESIEAACARELQEESGLVATRVTYHSSQPWPLSPLGGQLMIGLFAEVADGPAQADGRELAGVRWFTRAEAGALLDRTHPQASAPPPMAIAHQLLRGWVEGL